ncbi:MAG: hypothetical protein Q8S43_10680 [Actinomycetota bacterium]|nr:hypothetical protein [Actinomycetota bacterium]MDP3631398.1 hypothetical protein [Actinomycetota bacterium]
MLKLATWNVMLPVSERRRTGLRAYTDRINADVWVLTETHDGFSPGHPYSHSSDDCRDGQQGPGHRWVTIWSRLPLQPLKTSDSARTAAVRIFPPSDEPFVVFGTVLPWSGSTWRGFESRDGVAFAASLAVQRADWLRLRSEFPTDEFFVLGDINQDLVSSKPRYYGSVKNRAAFESALDSAGLTALTAGAGDPVRRDSAPCACIDHICMLRDSAWRADAAVRWPDAAIPERSLTDHFGIAVSLTRDEEAHPADVQERYPS